MSPSKAKEGARGYIVPVGGAEDKASMANPVPTTENRVTVLRKR